MEKNSFPRNFYYGWVVVGLAIVSMSYWFGLRTTFSLFFVALLDHFHWGRAETAGVQSVAMVAYTIAAPSLDCSSIASASEKLSFRESF